MTDKLNRHEAGLAQFLQEPGRGRLLRLLELGPKRRQDVRALLDHHLVFDPRYSEMLTGTASLAPAVESSLRKLGAPDAASILSSRPDLDGTEMPLTAALTSVVGAGFGSFISCLPGSLGYFEFESPGAAYILRK